MKEFHVLPTDPNFQALSSEQLDFIVASLEQDNREMKLAASGREEESYVNDNDFDFYSDKFEYGGKKDDTDELKEFLARSGIDYPVGEEVTESHEVHPKQDSAVSQMFYASEDDDEYSL